MTRLVHQARVVQKVENAILRINHHPVDNAVCFVNSYPLDSDLSGAARSVIHLLNIPGQCDKYRKLQGHDYISWYIDKSDVF